MKVRLLICLLVACVSQAHADDISVSSAQLARDFANPPVDTWPRTRWWWMGNAMTNEDITWQLNEMKNHGIGGVEQITMDNVYEKGNHPFLSPEYLDQIKHMVDVAQSLDMKVSFNFGGPGWIFGGDWIPIEDQNQCLISSALELDGVQDFSGSLSTDATINPLDVPRSVRTVRADDSLVAVVAGKVVNGKLAASSLTNITSQVAGRELKWHVPDGHWRVMAFRLTHMGKAGVVDHFNKAAMERYFEHVGNAFEQCVGKSFGTTIDSFFSDSFEVPVHRNAVYWNPSLLPHFHELMGYDLTTYLPAVWWQVDDLSPKIRYDVNAFLDHVAFEGFFTPFLDWCNRHHVKGRLQPYGFPSDILEGAGRGDIPETEITAGEKDAVPWFDTRVGPRTYVASGAHLYGRNIVSVEAYTYLHWQLYRENLEELKTASDMFLFSGANLFYNQGYLGTPERDIAPTRDFDAAIHIDHTNILWPYYPYLSRYIARSCYLLRQGRYLADIAVYSPLANQWAQNSLNACRWTRDFAWGDLGKLLWANGYNFDLINDDILQNRAKFDGQEFRVGENSYRLLIIPNVETLPLKSFERIKEYIAQGGVVIALERTPDHSTGLKDYEQQDARVREISTAMFTVPAHGNDTGHKAYEKGHTYQIDGVMDRTDPLDQSATVFDPFVNTVRQYVTPDFGIDFVRENLRENNGLVFNHRTSSDRDIYFIANVQDKAIDMPVSFRVTGRIPSFWDPCDGSVQRAFVYDAADGVTKLPLRLGPFASTFLVFEAAPVEPHLTQSTFDNVSTVSNDCIEAWTSHNGAHRVKLAKESQVRNVEVDGVPAPFAIEGEWTMSLESSHFSRVSKQVAQLESWTDHPDTKNFSGTGEYAIHFRLPRDYVADDIRLDLDLGEVGNIADVTVNGKSSGVRWYRSQLLDVSKTVQAGDNVLVVRVTNTLINRISGLDHMPPVPDDLAKRLGQGIHDADSATLNLIGFHPLPTSGLLGPVRLLPSKRVRIPRS